MTGQRAKAISLEDRDTCADLKIAGERVTCDWSGCLFWPDEETLVVSDLHLEKGAFIDIIKTFWSTVSIEKQDIKLR